MDELRGLLVPGRIRSAYQPVVRLTDGAVIGYEALARAEGFAGGPADWLAAADTAGWRAALERVCVDAAAANGPPPGDTLLFINISPALLLEHDLADARRLLSPRLVVELTEQEAVDDYDLLRSRLQSWADDGVRLAIDDTGAGHSSLRHVLELSPDFLKLDKSLVHGVHRDRKLQALVRSMVAFAAELGSAVVAEGIEEEAELVELRNAGVQLGQGWLLGRPAAPWPESTLPRTTRPGGRRRQDAELDPLVDDLLGTTDARGACAAACDHLRRAGELMPSAYLLRDGLLRCQAQRGYWQVMDGFPLDVGLLGRCATTGRRFELGEISADPEFVAAVPGLVAAVVMPLRIRFEVVGVFSVESALAIPPASLAFIDRVVALLEERLEEVGVPTTDSALARLARSSHELAGVAEMAELRRRVVRLACEVGLTSSGMLAERDRSDPGGPLVVTAAGGPLAPAFAALDVDALEALASSVDRVRSCYTADDPTGRTPKGSALLRAAGARFVAVLPLISRGQDRGVLVVADTHEQAASTDTIEALELLGAEAARSLELATLVAELRDRAATDALTGLGNHSSFHEALAAALAPGATVIVADIDGFKAVNDEHGHLVGDDLLRDLAVVVAGAVRPGDRLFRMGGDEIAAVLPGGGPDAGLAVATRLREAASTVLAPCGADLSIGVAVREPGEAPSAWLERADRSLYAAKGSDTRIVVSAPVSVSPAPG